MPDFLTLSNQQFSYQDICSSSYDVQSLDTYTQSTLAFCTAWLNQKQDFIIHTSGSTGTPKPIKLTRTQMQASAHMTGKALQLSAGQQALICLNTQYIAGLMMLVRGFELALQMTIIPPSANPLGFWENQHHPLPDTDFTALVPLQIQALLSTPQGKNWLNATKTIIVGGAAVNYALAQQIKTLKPAVYLTYGMTETVTHIALRRLSAPPSDVYQVLPQVEVRQDKRQCLEIKAPVTMDQWIATNDLVQLVGTGQFQWLGRVDRVINSGGVKVQAEVVEKALDKVLAQQGIHCRFFVAGLPDQSLGEKVVAILENEALLPHIQAQILEAAKKLLKKYEVPKQLHFMPVFAETPSAKTDRLQTLKRLDTLAKR